MTTRQQVMALLDQGLDIRTAAEQLGVPPGLAYLVATGKPADGSDAGDDVADEAEGGAPLRAATVPGSTQGLVNPAAVNPTRKAEVLAWLRHRAAADTPMRHAAYARSVEPPPAQDVPREPELTDELTRQHNRLAYLTKQLEALPGHTKHGSRLKVARRKAVADALHPRIVAHDAAEKQVLWPLVRELLPDGEAWEKRSSDLGVAALAERLVTLDPDTGEFDDVADQLIAQARRHDALTAALFPRLKQAAGRDRLIRLGGRVRAAAEPAPVPERRTTVGGRS